MKKTLFCCSLILLANSASKGAASEYKPGIFERLCTRVGETVKAAKNALGILPPDYCTSPAKETPQLYHDLASQMELRCCSPAKLPFYLQMFDLKIRRKDGRKESLDTTLKRVNDRNYYNLHYMESHIKENKAVWIEDVYKIATPCLPPILHLLAHVYLRAELIKKIGTDAARPPLFFPSYMQLSGTREGPLEIDQPNIERYGYLDWCMSHYQEHDMTSSQLDARIRETQQDIEIEGTWDKLWRTITVGTYGFDVIPPFEVCEKLISHADEVAKAKKTYANLIARILIASRTSDKRGARSDRNGISQLVCNKEFADVYRQVRRRCLALGRVFRNYFINKRFNDLTSLIENHSEILPPIYKVIICSIISASKREKIELVCPRFLDACSIKEVPCNKLIQLFITSLSQEQLRILRENREQIQKEISRSPQGEKANCIEAHIGKYSSNPNQMSLLTKLEEKEEILGIFTELESLFMATSERTSDSSSSSSSSAASSSSSSSSASPVITRSAAMSSPIDIRGPGVEIPLGDSPSRSGSYSSVSSLSTDASSSFSSSEDEEDDHDA